MAAVSALIAHGAALGAAAWGSGHGKISTNALTLLPPPLLQLLNTTTITFLGESGSAASFFGGAFAESGDNIAGPCEPNVTTPCSPARQAEKMAWREFCYAEDEEGRFAKAWPYAIPVCVAGTSTPPPGWQVCIPGPKTNPWLYHYFQQPPASDLGMEGRGGAWYIQQAAEAFRDKNVTKAALHLGCFAHGIEDRSSPYHAFGGFAAQRTAVETAHNLTAICTSHWPQMQPIERPRCEILFWGATEPSLQQFNTPGYQPLLLGADPTAAGAAVGARMEALAAASREICARPVSGYVATHLTDDNWWLGNSSAGPTAAITRKHMKRI